MSVNILEMILIKLSYPVQILRLFAVVFPEQVEFCVKIVHAEEASACLKKKNITEKLI